LIDLVGWLVGWEKEDEIDQNNRTIIHSFIQSVKQSNKQIREMKKQKRKRRQYNQTHPKEKS
jgi:hypothetical protein